MNHKLNQPIMNLIGILTVILLVTGGCSPGATPSPTAIPPTSTSIPPTSTSIPPTPAPTPDLISLVKAYEDAFNAHDLEATVAMFTETAVFQGDWIVAIFKGDIQAQHDYSFGLNQEIRNSECTIGNDAVTCKAVIKDDCVTAAGFDGANLSSIDYIFENRKIHKVTATFVSEELVAVNGFYMGMFGWGAMHRQEENRKLADSNGSNLYNRETGKIVAKLCQEYAATKP